MLDVRVRRQYGPELPRMLLWPYKRTGCGRIDRGSVQSVQIQLSDEFGIPDSFSNLFQDNQDV